MGLPVSEMLARVDSRELTEWAEYYKRHPKGDDLVCAQIALLITVVANMMRGKNDKPYEMGQFYMPELLKPKIPETPAQLAKRFRNYTIGVGGKVITRG